MSEIILTVDTPVLKGEKGDKGDTGSFDYGELERIVELNLGDKLEKINKSLEGKVNTDESHSMVDNNVISTFGRLEKWVDNPFVTKDENGKDIEEPRTIVKMFDTKIDSQDLDNKMEEAKGELQTYIDENLEASKSGDMLRSVYDKDRDGVVDLAKQADNAAKVNGKTVGTSVPENAVFTDTTYKDASVTEAGLMSAGDKVKLNGIASGATRVEVVDALDSTDISKALSANQGKMINESINSINTNIDTANSNIASISSSMENIDTRLNQVENEDWVEIDPSRVHITKGENCGGTILKQALYKNGFISLYLTCWASKTLAVGGNITATITFDDYEIVSANVPTASYAGTTALITSFTNEGVLNSRILANQYTGTSQGGSYGIHLLILARKK